jgi:hypothetical protein
MSGNIFTGKLSSDDKFLLPAIAKILIEIEPQFADKIHFTNKSFNKSTDISAFIATGSNNSARYFEYYFRNYPHIIRKNRNSVAVLNGNESEEDLSNLCKDIFLYFGLGCRNVSKIYIKCENSRDEERHINKIFSASVNYAHYTHHNKYANNYIYYRTMYLLNKEKFFDNGLLLIKEDSRIASPVATLYYEKYKNEEELFEKLLAIKEQIQCIVSNGVILSPLEKMRVKFGQTQTPELWNYADGVDTMEFLLSLHQ